MAGSVQHTAGRNLTSLPRFQQYNDADGFAGNDGYNDDEDTGKYQCQIQVCPATADGSSLRSPF